MTDAPTFFTLEPVVVNVAAEAQSYLQIGGSAGSVADVFRDPMNYVRAATAT